MTTLHAGTTFLLCDDAGQIAQGTQGIYFQDARFLSALELLIDGQAPIPLSTLRPSPRESTHVATWSGRCSAFQWTRSNAGWFFIRSRSMASPISACVVSAS